MPSTIRDVARAAGVSVATVSRVFNNSGPVHEQTRSRVREVASELRYSPNSAARSLITAKSNTLGVLLPDLYGEFFSEVIRGIDQTAQEQGYHVLVSSSHETQARIEGAMRAMRGRVDGLIVMSPDIDAPTLASNLPDTLPVVLLNCAVEGTSYDAISVDNFGGAYAMVRHLLSTGERVAIITGSSRNFDARERLRGYRAALRDAGAEQQEGWEIAGDFTETGGYRAGHEIAALSPRPTAVFAANDVMAIGALSAFRELGLRVPDDIAVAGFDDIPMARYMNPPLTSVHVEISELGARAMSVLLAAVKEKNRHERGQVVLPTTVVVRKSCRGGSQPV
ncbi:MAG TPA: LacI family DNA-binding transcriptional regulator [Gemmatimonadaceae bacterium]|nr:LacI family DNA-binding transcriptional regulator [Gemmatimonadaceae bacterium]